VKCTCQGYLSENMKLQWVCEVCGRKELTENHGALNMESGTALSQWKSFLTEQGIPYEEIDLEKEIVISWHPNKQSELVCFMMFNPDGSLYKPDIKEGEKE
jgi:hypothetical protein